MAKLILGPLLRYVSETEATVWVETDGSCEVEVASATARRFEASDETFEVEEHHYALVCADDLEPGQHLRVRGGASTASAAGRCPTRSSRRA